MSEPTQQMYVNGVRYGGFPCEGCGATAGERCRTRSGRPAKWPHVSRWNAWDAVQEKGGVTTDVKTIRVMLGESVEITEDGTYHPVWVVPESMAVPGLLPAGWEMPATRYWSLSKGDSLHAPEGVALSD